LFSTIFSSFLLVGVGEFGDKTQLLALALASRFRRPWAVMGGILAATLLNHALAAALGAQAVKLVSPRVLHLILAALFLGFGVWALEADSLDDEEARKGSNASAFWTTGVLFFLAEMGDKTQLATIALGARFGDPLAVTLGTTLGMLAADGFAVFLGERYAGRLPMKLLRRITAGIFVAFGIAAAFAAFRFN
jgi:putative Ca2+/H+ antiporter (TMEM165/GDT1 family)